MSAELIRPSSQDAEGKSLLETFRTLDGSTKGELADLQKPLLLAFAALYISNEKTGIARLSSEHIVACLEAAGVAVSKAAISNSLNRAGNRVSKQVGPLGENVFRLMTQGERAILPFLGKGSLEVIRVDGCKPRTDRLRVREILSALRGVVRICDPYYGFRTLDNLEAIPATCSVRFLTAKTTEGGRKLSSALVDFKREQPNVEFRIANNPNELHDRYVLTDPELLLVGHGLKDIGGKESFIIRVEKKWAPDLIRDVRVAFDSRWTIGKLL